MHGKGGRKPEIENNSAEAVTCWEFMGCSVKESCPAYPDNGRRCARLVGTLCGSEPKGEYAKKILNCMLCSYYKSEHYKIED